MHATGGHYAHLPPADFQAKAAHYTQGMINSFRAITLNPQLIQQDNAAQDPLVLADQQQRTQAMNARLLPFAAEHLAAQPELHLELLRRMNLALDRYRGTITSLQLDAQIEQLQQTIARHNTQ